MWTGLAEYLRESLKPNLVVATGDLADSPRERWIKAASDALSGLGFDYLVCPGNHDRHSHGGTGFGSRQGRETRTPAAEESC